MDELFEKLINDRLTPSELKTLRERFNAASDEELASLIDCRDIENHEPGDVSQGILDKVKANISGRLFSDPANRSHSYMRTILKVAAILIPLIITGCVWLIITDISHSPESMCTVTTDKNETTSIQLPDGTSVKINGNSTFSFPSGFSENNREVTFSGEAYFDVTRNPDSPMTISTPTMTISVKGTSFNLMSRPGARYSELSLDSGSVTVTRQESDETIDMSPGYRLILDNTTGTTAISPINTPHNTSSWTAMEIYFDNASPAYLIDRIEQTYGITLDTTITGRINENFSGTLPADNLDEALRIIRRIYAPQ